MDLKNDHLRELYIATTPGHPRRILPPVLKSDRTVLDVGCGAGQTLIATTFEPGTTLVGLDCDTSALNLGRQMDQTICFVCGRGDSLPFESETFDFVFSRVALPYMHINETLSEIFRVLKRSGRVWLTLHPYSMVVREMLESMLQLKIKRAGVCAYVLANGVALNFAGREFHLPFRTDYFESFQTVGGIKKLLGNAGFDEIEARRTNFFVATARKVA